MPTYQKAPPEVVELANGILKEFDSHKPLLESRVSVDYIMAYADVDDNGEPTNNAITKSGQRCFGLCRKLPVKERIMGRGDAEILLDGDWWGTVDEPQQRAVLDHELHHIALKAKNGIPEYDSAGRPVIKLRKHDVEVGWFALIAKRHGKHSMEQVQAKAIMDAMGQFFWPQLAAHDGAVTTTKRISPSPASTPIATAKKRTLNR